MIKSYRDLDVYNEGYVLGLEMYRLSTRIKQEDGYVIAEQLRRASISIPLNIVEGYGKKDSVAEFKRFLRMSVGSVNEVEVLLTFLKDLSYLSEEDHARLMARYETLGKRLNTLIKKWS